MKRILFTLSLVGALFIASCNNDVDDKFDQDSLDRVNSAVAEWNTILTTPQNGWVMQFYPEKSQKYGGCNMLVKFEVANNGDKKVRISNDLAVLNAPTDVVTSTYDILRYDGPTLSFQEFNEMLHYFRNPDIGDVGDGKYGYEGDQEFVLPEITPAIIAGEAFEIRGLQTRNKIRMIPMDETETWASYLTAIENMRVTLSDANIGAYSVTLDGVNLRLEEEGMYFRVKYGLESLEPKDFAIEAKSMAYIITKTGIRFYDKIKVPVAEGQEEPNSKDDTREWIQELVWNPATKTFTSEESIEVRTISPANKREDYFGPWKINMAKTGTIKTVDVQVDGECVLGWRTRLKSVADSYGYTDPPFDTDPDVKLTVTLFFNKVTGGVVVQPNYLSYPKSVQAKCQYLDENKVSKTGIFTCAVRFAALTDAGRLASDDAVGQRNVNKIEWVSMPVKTEWVYGGCAWGFYPTAMADGTALNPDWTVYVTLLDYSLDSTWNR